MSQDHNIQAIFFDFGGVLLQHMDGIDHRAIETRLRLPERTLMRVLYRDSRYLDFQVGACTWEEWVASVWRAATEHAGDKAADLMRAWQEAEHPLNPDMIALARRLRPRYRLGIISNTIPGMEERLQQRFPEIVSLFDVRLGSGDLRIAKPDPQIFLFAAEAAGVAPEQAVFTDDVKAYAEAARSVGMHAFHFTGYHQFVADLRSLGIVA